MCGGVEHIGHALGVYRSCGKHIATLGTGGHVRVGVPQRSERRQVRELTMALGDRIEHLILADSLHLRKRSSLMGCLLRLQQVWDGYCCDYADDRDYDQQLD